jgi:hypothetical protein
MKVEPFPFKILALDSVFQLRSFHFAFSMHSAQFLSAQYLSQKRCAFSAESTMTVVAFFASLVSPFAS